MLKLTAEMIETTNCYMIKLSLDGVQLPGAACANGKDVHEVLALLNGATDMRELVQELAEAKGWHGTASPDCTCLPCRARKIVAKSKGGQR